jgi:hypothetical protein
VPSSTVSDGITNDGIIQDGTQVQLD